MKAEEIKGWMRPAELEWIRARAANVQMIIEIGAHRGRSTRAWLDAMPANGKIWVVDPWAPNERNRYQGDPDFYQFLSNLADGLNDGRVSYLRALSQDVADRFDKGAFDLVFIDGDHRTSAVTLDIALYRPKLKRGGILSGHDFGNPGIRGALKKHGLLDKVQTTNSGTPQQIWWLQVD